MVRTVRTIRLILKPDFVTVSPYTDSVGIFAFSRCPFIHSLSLPLAPLGPVCTNPQNPRSTGQEKKTSTVCIVGKRRSRRTYSTLKKKSLRCGDEGVPSQEKRVPPVSITQDITHVLVLHYSTLPFICLLHPPIQPPFPRWDSFLWRPLLASRVRYAH